MLNKGLKDKESERIDNVLKTLLSFVFVPKFWNNEDTIVIDNHLTNLGLTTEVIITSSQNELLDLLQRLKLDWSQQEQFADFLIALSRENPFCLVEKAIAIYENIQTESKSFSFGIFNKIALSKASL
ncbi:hypothetical protein SAMN05444396_103391 [Flavobacterium segetis]|uniref:Uncharacterized protein n=1 Tax=Flavobacterium segetis TaxID=271157 RepID=A0A1M5GAV1_9FLAO|nr:hypothetical protein [Flavobacterium segetis]SHG00826.1 hypothetical protein SAMN05444396_103391 [Flavobacterium segetis]